jgi:hypothetical protein
MRVALIFLSVLLISSCASQKITQESFSPFDKEIVMDLQPVTDSKDLKQLIKSLPLWDCPPPHCPAEVVDGWISRNSQMKDDTLFIAGDGAQVQLRITRLSAEDYYEVEVGSKEWPEGGYDIYKLKRLRAGGGWKVLAREKPVIPLRFQSLRGIR